MDADRQLSLPARLGVTTAIYAGAMSIYYTAGTLARSELTDISTPLDDAIPFVPGLMAAYALAYVVPATTAWLARTPAELKRLGSAVLLAYAMAAPFHLLLPIQGADPPLDADRALEHALHWNRIADQTNNAFPSMHVGLATLLALVGWRRSRAWGVALTIVVVAITVSTLFVKQHFLADLPAGALVGWLAFRIVYRRGSGVGALFARGPDPPSG